MKRLYLLLVLFLSANIAYALPHGFVYLRDVDPSILQDMRYASSHNFVGEPIAGYEAGECILTKDTALALAKIQKQLNQSSLTLKVYDCYRPTAAVDHFIAWSKDRSHQEMKAEFYPMVNKADVFSLGYVAMKSGHSRGSTVDLTIVPLPSPTDASYMPGQKLISCSASYQQRYRDNSIDMGTGFDCFDELAHGLNKNVTPVVYKHRMMLRKIMIEYGFVPYENEWWHFTLKNEPYPHNYFNFPVK